MANVIQFTPYGGIQVKAGVAYTSANVPTGMNVVKLTRGVRITDESGTATPIRGVRVTITGTGATAPVSPLDNIPFVWHECETFKFIAGASYTFQDDGIVAYGKEEIL